MKKQFALLFLGMLLVGSVAQADLTGCAAPYVLVPGDPARGFGAFCIDSRNFVTNGQDFAVTGCANGQGYLCSTMEYQRACMARVITTTPGTWSYTSDIGMGSYQRISMKLWGGGANCWDKQDAFAGLITRSYRCCTR